MSYESDAETADDRFWTRPVLALALVLVVVRAPAILSQPTAAGMLGAVVGGSLAALTVAGLVKAAYVTIAHFTR